MKKIFLVLLSFSFMSCSSSSPELTALPTFTPVPTTTPTPNADQKMMLYLQKISDMYGTCSQPLTDFGDMMGLAVENPSLLQSVSYLARLKQNINKVESFCMDKSVSDPPEQFIGLNDIIIKIDNEFRLVIAFFRSAFEYLDPKLLSSANAHLDLLNKYMNEASAWMNKNSN